jgi:hypothetical protein
MPPQPEADDAGSPHGFGDFAHIGSLQIRLTIRLAGILGAAVLIKEWNSFDGSYWESL